MFFSSHVCRLDLNKRKSTRMLSMGLLPSLEKRVRASAPCTCMYKRLMHFFVHTGVASLYNGISSKLVQSVLTAAFLFASKVCQVMYLRQPRSILTFHPCRNASTSQQKLPFEQQQRLYRSNEQTCVASGKKPRIFDLYGLSLTLGTM